MEKQRKGVLKRFKGQREIKCSDWKDLEREQIFNERLESYKGLRGPKKGS